MAFNKIVAFAIVVLLIAAGGGAFWYYRNIATWPAAKQAPMESEKQVVLQDKTIKDSTKPFSIDITYPFAAGVDGFNKLVQDAVNGQLEDFKKVSMENDSAIKQNDPQSYAKYPREYDLNISYAPGEVDANIISVVLNVENYEGGAHGAHYFIPINYNVKTGKTITLSDVFVGQGNYVQKISAFCIADLRRQFSEMDFNYSNDKWLVDGAGPKEENFSVFLLDKSAVTFYFPEYQVAAYAAGSFRVVMPR